MASAVINAARDLLTDLEQTDIETLAPLTPATPPYGPREPSDGSVHDAELAGQLTRLAENLRIERETCEELRAENARLTHDIRSIATQMKQERAASNAVLAVQVGGGAAGGLACVDEAHKYGTEEGGVDTNGLTLASAASQILLLRREVKFLQKQWNSARRDGDSVSHREHLQQLQEAVEESRKAAAEAKAQASGAAARNRLLLRELQMARGQLKAQQARMTKRSHAQAELVSMQAQLQRARDVQMQQQHQIKQLQLRERLRSMERGGKTDAAIVAAADEELHRGAAAEIGLLLMCKELSTVERYWQQDKAAAAELIAIKSDMTIRVAQAEDEKLGLQVEVSRMRQRIAQLQEEKEVMASSLNSLNNDLAGQSEEVQHAAAQHAAAAGSAPPPPPLPPPPPPPPDGPPRSSSSFKQNEARLPPACASLARADAALCWTLRLQVREEVSLTRGFAGCELRKLAACHPASLLRIAA
ncbi:hypothetical protein AB1Y20_013408 [Prymnesium parvum]|uniref:Uncharacterized protein n=1 Tax=Prymnesium parvum TaxID=97485 RepID=A0AB34IHM5_PRYPA